LFVDALGTTFKPLILSVLCGILLGSDLNFVISALPAIFEAKITLALILVFLNPRTNNFFRYLECLFGMAGN